MHVNIVGAGISGLYAGHILKQAGIGFTIFEASNRYGGRIQSCAISDDQRYELGAEIIHGAEPQLLDLLKKSGNHLVPNGGQAFYWYQQELATQYDLGKRSDVNQMLLDLGDRDGDRGEDISLLDFYKKKQYFNKDMIGILECYAGEYGTSAARLGIKSLGLEQDTWSNAHENYFSRNAMQNSCDFLYAAVRPHVKFNSKITRIDYLNNKILLNSLDGRQFESDLVFVSVPLGVLKANDIAFNPTLPAEKLSAIRQLGIDKGIKIILRFSKRWWPQDLFAVKGGELCPEYLSSLSYEEPTLIGFVMGSKAAALQGKSRRDMADMLVHELNTIFKHRLAEKTLRGFYCKDWGNDPLQKGAYSFTSTHSLGMRQTLAKPIDNRLFFLGEACNTSGHAATIHGAIETAVCVCKKVVDTSKGRINTHP